MAEILDTASEATLDTASAPITDVDVNFLLRLKSLLPSAWLPYGAADTPVLDAILTGAVSILNNLWALLTFTANGVRLTTATGPMLDLWGQDFYGSAGARRSGEGDASYRARLEAMANQAKSTRAAVIAAIEDAVSATPTIIEPTYASDCKGYGGASATAVGGGYGYGAGVHYGHLSGGSFFVTMPAGTDMTAVATAVNAAKAAGITAWIVEETS